MAQQGIIVGVEISRSPEGIVLKYIAPEGRTSDLSDTHHSFIERSRIKGCKKCDSEIIIPCSENVTIQLMEPQDGEQAHYHLVYSKDPDLRSLLSLPGMKHGQDNDSGGMFVKVGAKFEFEEWLKAVSRIPPAKRSFFGWRT